MIWRRRKSIVNMEQQVWFGLELVVVAIGFVILTAFLIFVSPISDLFGGTVDATLLNDLGRLISLKWPVVMMSLAVLFIIGVLMSHRLAGPLFGLEKTLASLKQGDRGARVRFRKYDYLISIMKPLNEFLEEEEMRLKQIESLAQQIASESSAEASKARAKEILSLIEKKEPTPE